LPSCGAWRMLRGRPGDRVATYLLFPFAVLAPCVFPVSWRRGRGDFLSGHARFGHFERGKRIIFVLRETSFKQPAHDLGGTTLAGVAVRIGR
jgi:hypothetical protein